MGNLFYIVKMILITIALILVMQIEVDHKTIESHAESFIQQSQIMSPVRDIAQGGFRFFKVAYHNVGKTVDSFFTKNFRSENAPGKRKLVELKRSLGFEKEQQVKEEKRRAQENNEDSDLE